MHLVFNVGLEPFHLQNEYGGAILFVVIACLTLSPLAFLYVAIAVTCSVLNFLIAHASMQKSDVLTCVVEALHICGQATLYFSLYFPFVMGVLSTHVSYQTPVDQQRRQETNTRIRPAHLRALSQSLEPWTMKLEVDKMIEDKGAGGSRVATRYWKVPAPGITATGYSTGGRNNDVWNPKMGRRLVARQECSICMKRFEFEETIAWSSNQLCIHIFHSDCILKWTALGGTPPNNFQSCPCCRRIFLLT
ncbi:expressed unknown protein [Seminavis robusta]|uniref:RING-type domain-containing protein n=1 Tax=Seminavis robusta TaxID=568900 RepID=A0A9N8H2R9_9STRA|nr:expressed unknown protein [Seminavis robusta]|eukprot:Sro71_g039570.1 n/a (248) ;mRNA; r:115829-116717